MTQKTATVPLKNEKGKMTPPWTLQKSEFSPRNAYYKPLVNGAEAFAAVHKAIEKAEHSINIICWAFQPTMLFIRDGKSPSIGKLLEQKIEKNPTLQVRILCFGIQNKEVIETFKFLQKTAVTYWEDWGFNYRKEAEKLVHQLTNEKIAELEAWYQENIKDIKIIQSLKKGVYGVVASAEDLPESFYYTLQRILTLPERIRAATEAGHEINITGLEMLIGESPTPGRGNIRFNDHPDFMTAKQYLECSAWFRAHDQQNTPNKNKKQRPRLQFYSRGFNANDMQKIRKQSYYDKGFSSFTKEFLGLTPSQHQKMVIIDYEHPDKANGFIMGHNMLDSYWDTNEHSYYNKNSPDLGRHVRMPMQELSSQVSGEVIADMAKIFKVAWERETRQTIPAVSSHARYASSKTHKPDKAAILTQVQLLRTQIQYNKMDIMQSYLQVIQNACRMIYIENQYFRWPPLAEEIVKVAKRLTSPGKGMPGAKGALHVFVVTNSNDKGIGKGVLNTYRMLKVLGQANTIPHISRQEKRNKLYGEIMKKRAEKSKHPTNSNKYKALEQEINTIQKKYDRLLGNTSEELPEQRPGLKIHICTLAPPDNPNNYVWRDTYVHSKLMIIDDTFMTIGTANINSRSMQVDSEINLCHCHPDITRALRQRLWKLHTNNQKQKRALGAQDDPAVAFKEWEYIIKINKKRKKDQIAPLCALLGFEYNGAIRKNLD